MNVLAIFVLVIFIVFAIIGYKRGLIKSVFKIVLTGVALLLAYIFSPMVSNIIINHTNMDDSIRNRIYVKIEEAVKSELVSELEEVIDDAGELVDDQLVEEILSQELTKNQQVDFIQNMNMPEFIRTALIESNHSEMRAEMGVSGFYDYIATYLSYMIINAIVFFAIFIFLNLILSLTMVLMSFVVKLPGLNGLNRLGGLVLALFEALIIVWLFFIIVDVAMTTEFGSGMYSQIRDNKLLSFIYDNNVIAGFIRKTISSF